MTPPHLRSYDWILVNSSGGKDSQAMLDYVVSRCAPEVPSGRIVVVHADLGRVEWKGVSELAEEQAAHCGLRFETVRRDGDLLEQVEKRGMWPSSFARYCTSDQKRGPIRTLMTRLTRETWAARGGKPQVRILNCLGLRADESPARRKKAPFEFDASASNGARHVDTWLPIHDWSTDQVWQRIRESGVRHHEAYDLGMPRLSCCFCIFAPKAALMIAGKANPELLNEYVALEERIGHTFRQGFRIAEVKEALANGESCGPATSWSM